MGTVLAIARFQIVSGLRRPAVILVLVAAALLSILLLPPLEANYATLMFEDRRPLYSSEVVGLIVGAVGVMLALPLFFVLLRQTYPLGDQPALLVASAPVSMPAFFLGRMLADTALLTFVVVSLGAGGLAIQAWRGEVPELRPAELFAPLLLMAVPTLALTAAFRALVEANPWTRGRWADALAVVAWIYFLSVAAMKMTGQSPMSLLGDPAGVSQPLNLIRAGGAEVSVGIAVGTAKGLQAFAWAGFDWFDPGYLASRAGWLLIAVLATLAAGLTADRFRPRARSAGRGERAAGEGAAPLPLHAIAVRRSGRAARTLQVLWAELRIGASGRLWLAAVLGLLIAGAVQDPAAGYEKIIPLAFGLLTFRLADLGVRATGGGMDPVGRCVPMSWPLHAAVGWAAGTALLLLPTLGALGKLVMTGHGAAVWSAAGTAALLSAAALAGGRILRSPVPYTVLSLIYSYMLLSGGFRLSALAA